MSNTLPITRTRNNLNVLLQPNAIPSAPAVLIDMHTVIKSLIQNSLESALDNIIKAPWQINAMLPAVRTIEHSKRNENHVGIVIPENGTDYYGIVTSVYMIQLHAITHDVKLVTCVQYNHLADEPKETITAVYTGDLTIVEDYIKSIGITHSPKLAQGTTTMTTVSTPVSPYDKFVTTLESYINDDIVRFPDSYSSVRAFAEFTTEYLNFCLSNLCNPWVGNVTHVGEVTINSTEQDGIDITLPSGCVISLTAETTILNAMMQYASADTDDSEYDTTAKVILAIRELHVSALPW